jgi:cell division protein FtsW
MLKKMLRNYDYSLIISILLLCVFGLIMIYSASIVTSVEKYETSSDYFFIRQLIWLFGGLAVFVCFMVFPYKAYRKFVVLILFVSISLLILVLFFGVERNFAKSWFEIGGFTLQPAEFVKLGLIIYLASVFGKKQGYISEFKKGVAPPLIVILIISFLIYKQPDFGTMMIIGATSGVMVFCSGMRWKHIIALLGTGVSGVLLMWKGNILSSEQISRIHSAYDPFADAAGGGYQLIHSYIAIATGGVTGKGLGQSIEKYGWLPEAHTDFIIAVVAEEMGALGVIFIISLIGYIVVKGFLTGLRCKDPFGSLLAFGISGMIGVQTIVNLGAASGLLPITGVTLPFISYGGSSLLVLLASTGILVNVSMFVNYNRSKQIDSDVQEKKGKNGKSTIISMNSHQTY